MSRRSVFTRIFAAAAMCVVAAVLSALLGGLNHHLLLTDADTGAVYAHYPLGEGDRFSVEFVHSVNQSPVRDIYEVRDGTDIYVVETDYFAFGAGVQTELNPGETLTYGEDGSMRVAGIDSAIPRLAYMVGTVSDHTLRIGGQTISLRALCGRNSNVVFTVN